MVDHRVWLSQTPLRQFKTSRPGREDAAAELTPSILTKLERRSIPWLRMYDLKPQDLGELVRMPRIGRALYQVRFLLFPVTFPANHARSLTRSPNIFDDCFAPAATNQFVHRFPKIELEAHVQVRLHFFSLLSIRLFALNSFVYSRFVSFASLRVLHVQPITRSILRFELTIEADFEYLPEVHDWGVQYHVLVEDSDGDELLHHELFTLRGSQMEDSHTVAFTVAVTEPLPPQVSRFLFTVTFYANLAHSLARSPFFHCRRSTSCASSPTAGCTRRRCSPCRFAT